MANVLHKFVQSRPTRKLVSTLIAPGKNHPKFIPPISPETGLRFEALNHPFFLLNPNSESAKPLYFYPSFPFGHSSNPVLSSDSDLHKHVEAEEIESDDARKIWADSVKKKRKKKMNKHKHQKLRKRNRRKT